MKFYQKIRTIVDTAGNTRDLIFSATGISTKYNNETEYYLLYGIQNLTNGIVTSYSLPYDITPIDSTQTLGTLENPWNAIYCKYLNMEGEITSGSIEASNLNVQKLILGTYSIYPESTNLIFAYNNSAFLTIDANGLLTIPTANISNLNTTDLNATNIITTSLTINGTAVSLGDVSDLSFSATDSISMVNPGSGLFIIMWIVNSTVHSVTISNITNTTYLVGDSTYGLNIVVNSNYVIFSSRNASNSLTYNIRTRILKLGA